MPSLQMYLCKFVAREPAHELVSERAPVAVRCMYVPPAAQEDDPIDAAMLTMSFQRKRRWA